MEAIEKDRSDLGLSVELSKEDLDELREMARARARIEREGAPSGPPALPHQRGEAMESVRRAMGWGVSRSERLAQPCDRCGASALRWCRVAGREVSAKLCTGRGAD
jgi:hypothetical protein